MRIGKLIKIISRKFGLGENRSSYRPNNFLEYHRATAQAPKQVPRLDLPQLARARVLNREIDREFAQEDADVIARTKPVLVLQKFITKLLLGILSSPQQQIQSSDGIGHLKKCTLIPVSTALNMGKSTQIRSG